MGIVRHGGWLEARWWLLLSVLICWLGAVAGQGLPVPGKPGLSSRDYARVRNWTTEGVAWRASYAAAPSAVCNSQPGSLCASSPGKEAYGQLLVATSPADYDARRDAGLFSPISAVTLDQRPCQASVAFAVVAAAEAAAASALQVDAGNISLSQQDLQFCNPADAGLTCQDTWDVAAAAAKLVNSSIVSYECLPFTAGTSSDASQLCSYRCKNQSQLLQGGKFKVVPVRSPLEAQKQIRRYGAFVTRFNVYPDFLVWVNTTAATDPAAVYECPSSADPPPQAQAVAVVGYSNTDGYWIVKNSWGPGLGDKGFFRVRFGVCGVLAPGDTLGLSFTPAQPRTLQVSGPVPDPAAPAGAKGRTCYTYKAQPGDYVSKVALDASILVTQLLLDNNSTLLNLSQPLNGTQLLLCDPDNATVSTAAPKPQPVATAAATAPAATAPAATAPASTAPALTPPAVTPPAATTAAGVSLGAAVAPSVPSSSQGASVFPTRPANTTRADEAAALLALAAALGFNSPSWQPGTDPCSKTAPWPNLYCNRLNRVYMIDLSSKGLTGTLGEGVDLSRIPFLQAIWLYDNPALTGTLPASWSKLDLLKEASLYGCSLSGPLPPSWGSMRRLKLLYLQNNKFTGSLPAAWGSLATLTNLGLATNQLTGSIPSTWSSMSALTSVSLYDNAGLAGCLPSAWLKRPKGSTVKMARPADNIRPLAGTKLCRVCSDTCLAAAAGPTAGTAAPGAAAPLTPGAAAGTGPVVPRATGTAPLTVPPVVPSPVVPPTGVPPVMLPNMQPVVVPAASPVVPPAAAVPVVPPVAAPVVQPALSKPVVPQTPVVPPVGGTPGAAATGPKAGVVGGTAPGAAQQPIGSVFPTAPPVVPKLPSPAQVVPPPTTPPVPSPPPTPPPVPVPTPAPVAPKAAVPAVVPGASPQLPAIKGAITGAAASLGQLQRSMLDPAPSGTSAAAAAAAAGMPGSVPVKTAAANIAAAITPTVPAAAPPAPQAALVAAPPPTGSLPVPIDPNLTVVRDTRKPNFQDVQSSGRRRLMTACW